MKSVFGAFLAGLTLLAGSASAADGPSLFARAEQARLRSIRSISFQPLEVPPAPVYGEPAPQYGTPAPMYGAPVPQYGSPMPMPGYPAPIADPAFGPLPAGISSGALFHNVRYEDKRNIHPCAVPKIVQVPDPCADPCSSCGPKCVDVLICVPPCECVDVSVSRDGEKVKYDYGKYTVQITSRRGVVVVDYDD